MATYPLPTLAAQVTQTGISAPAFEDILNSEIATEQGIFGADIVLTPDSQDYERLVTRCTAINDANQMAIAVYQSFSPAFAQGAGLSAQVQINGLTRKTDSNSTVPVTISGVAGTIIQNGVAIDVNGNLWNLPSMVMIPDSGAITVTATAQQAGAINAQPGEVNRPWTIITGWQSITNADAATPGNAVETDAALRQRQQASVALPSQTPLDAIAAAVGQVEGVGRSLVYQNDTNETDGNGIPSHSIAAVAEGGNVTAIAQAIQATKAPGTGTYGTTNETVFDQQGLPITIRFFELTEEQIYAALTIHPLAGYVSTTGIAAVNAIVAFLNSLGIGQTVYLNQLIGIAGLSGNALSQTFVVTSLTIGTSPGSLSAANITIPFNAAAICSSSNVTLTTA